MSDVYWTGVFNHEDHHSTGLRAWCRCGEWCYPSDPCSCCEKNALDNQTVSEVLAERDALKAQVERAHVRIDAALALLNHPTEVNGCTCLAHQIAAALDGGDT